MKSSQELQKQDIVSEEKQKVQEEQHKPGQSNETIQRIKLQLLLKAIDQVEENQGNQKEEKD